jgi:hypothetical protein
MEDFPKKLETEINDGDLKYGNYEVYYASEIEAWIESLRKVLRDKAYDQTVLQHGNEAKMILKTIDASILASKANED